MEIRKCTLEDVSQLAVLNKQLIEDEQSNNPMTVKELEERMSGKCMHIKEYKNTEQEQNEVLHFLEEVLPESGRNLDAAAIQQYVKSLEQFEKVWCLYDGSSLIGTVGIRRLDEINCELKALYLYSKYHGQGLGYRLLSTALEEAKRAGFVAMYLDTISTSERAIKLYKSVGFEEIEQYKETIRSDVFMRKQL
ncbi:MAG: GNAT family N-acetyltransferase [Lachnospiraceae bacterium]|nr:GNAT family N-acetyltransferase [Lachnospiraceae bacterium]